MGKCYSTNGEDFCHDDLDGVLDALDCEERLEVGAVYYEADSQPLTVAKLLRADMVLEQADELGYDLIGETWDNPFSVSKEAKVELQEVLNAWAAKHVDLSHYYEIVGSSRELRVTEDDLPANNQGNRTNPSSG